MSDPMTNTEVEDILASIRRLVSDDTRPEPEEKKPAQADRLVLTPALRVMEDPVEDQVDDVVKDMVEEASLASEDDLATEHAEVEMTSAIPTPEDHAHADVGDDLTNDQVAAPQDNDTGDAGETVEDADDMPQSDALDEDTPDVDQAVEEETPISLDAVNLDQNTLMSIQDAFTYKAALNVADTSGSAFEEPPATTPLQEKIAALETLIAGQTNEFEPDMAGDGDNAGTEPPTLEWEDATDADVDDGEPDMAATEVHAPAEDAQLFSSDEDVLDEEALRDLVSDIVREELQGALGERITRNVRKLVRREIHRALAAQDLE